MNSNTIKRRSATAECRPQGGISSRTSKNYPRILQETLDQQWTQIKPKWFITIQWTPAAINFETASGHSRLFRNKLLTTIYDCHLKQHEPCQSGKGKKGREPREIHNDSAYPSFLKQT